jgi:hypothetical protein
VGGILYFPLPKWVGMESVQRLSEKMNKWGLVIDSFSFCGGEKT